MARVVIAGHLSSLEFTEAKYIAECLAAKIQGFNHTIIVKTETEWPYWLEDMNKTNMWNHTKCPLVYKELAFTGGRGTLIGDLSEFLEYCYDFYSLDHVPKRHFLEVLREDNMKVQAMLEKDKRDYQLAHKQLRVFLVGGRRPVAQLLAVELCQQELRPEGIQVLLYDPNCSCHSDVRDVLWDVRAMRCSGNLSVVTSIVSGMSQSDVIVWLQDFPRSNDELWWQWLARCRAAASELTKDLNAHARPSCRLLLAANAPLCFLATAIAEDLTAFDPRNVVVVVGDIVYEAMSAYAECRGLPASLLCAVPVWGFVGVNYVADYKRCLFVVPNPEYEERGFSLQHVGGLLSGEDNSFTITSERSKVITRLDRPPALPRVLAVVQLLKHWLVPATRSVISLGIMSDGSFDLPRGMWFCQPSILEKDVWKPYSKFPTVQDPICSLKYLSRVAGLLLRRFDIGQRLGGEWLQSDEEQARLAKQRVLQRIQERARYAMQKMRRYRTEQWALRQCREKTLKMVESEVEHLSRKRTCDIRKAILKQWGLEGVPEEEGDPEQWLFEQRPEPGEEESIDATYTSTESQESRGLLIEDTSYVTEEEEEESSSVSCDDDLSGEYDAVAYNL